MNRRIAAAASRLAAIALVVLAAACQGETGGGDARRAEGPTASASAARDATLRGVPPLPPAAPEDDPPPRVVFLGDSLTAGFGLGEGDAWPARVSEALAAEGLPIEAVNAGVSGDTSAGGLSRVDWILRGEPDVVVVELGPNDGLRGLPLDATEDNLRQIVRRIEDAGADVLLVGLQIPPNYGPEYSGRFRDLYPRLAAELDVPLVPFLLEGVGGEPELNLPDGLHPNAAGHRILAENVVPYLRPLVAEVTAGGSG